MLSSQGYFDRMKIINEKEENKKSAIKKTVITNKTKSQLKELFTIISELDDLKVKKLYLYTKTANLQKYFGKTMDSEEENVKRAELIKQIIKE